jgi:predicted outer membrane repeat protein
MHLQTFRGPAGRGVTVAGGGSLTSIDNNTASDSGGGLYTTGGTLTASGSSLTNNSALGSDAIGAGGGWYNSSATASWTGGSISDNNAINGLGLGGGVYNSGGGSKQLTLDGVQITGNQAHKGGGVYVYDKFVTFTNCTVSGNRADVLGTAIAYKDQGYLTYSFSGGSCPDGIVKDS